MDEAGFGHTSHADAPPICTHHPLQANCSFLLPLLPGRSTPTPQPSCSRGQLTGFLSSQASGLPSCAECGAPGERLVCYMESDRAGGSTVPESCLVRACELSTGPSEDPAPGASGEETAKSLRLANTPGVWKTARTSGGGSRVGGTAFLTPQLSSR